MINTDDRIGYYDSNTKTYTIVIIKSAEHEEKPLTNQQKARQQYIAMNQYNSKGKR